jgi:hypothetical protein
MEISLLIHVDNALDLPQRTDLEQKVIQMNGVTAAKFSTDKNHLMFVQYDPAMTTSTHVLRQVQGAGVGAQLVGL